MAQIQELEIFLTSTRCIGDSKAHPKPTLIFYFTFHFIYILKLVNKYSIRILSVTEKKSLTLGKYGSEVKRKKKSCVCGVWNCVDIFILYGRVNVFHAPWGQS